MKADYATSDLISKVNSDWINTVLLNPDLDRPDDRDEVVAGDITLQSDSGRQVIPMWPRPAAESLEVEEPVIDADATVPPSRRRSVARRVTERMALAVMALAIGWTGIQMAPEPTNSVSAQTTNASPESATPISTTEPRPAWLLPEILYGPAMASSPISAPRSGR
jgi:hypothetical protein